VLLEVVASGRFIRYERGLRYSRQRVRTVRVGRCGCGRTAIGLVDGGSGFVGWRCLAAVCAVCAADRPYLTFGEFMACLDEPVGVGTDTFGLDADTVGLGADTIGAVMMPSVMSPGAPGSSSIVVLTAEIALMQARLDDLQARVARYNGDSDGTR
jgi:hypothetical protein